jgi:hypothetical protein
MPSESVPSFKSPFQVYAETWWTTSRNKEEGQNIVRAWQRVTKSERSFYVKAARTGIPIDKSLKIFQF